ncbi:MAG: glycosyltransferase family 2 protein [Paludibacteraceae bacterium]|nr:glycosyltransferase family 2 protein [Paludibacteraceae bacterium]
MKRIAIITMSRNDNFFLEKWISYYGKQIGFENIFIYLDGLDSDVPQDTSGKVNIVPCEKIPGPIGQAEPGRLAFLSDRAAERFADGYEMVIGCDADEYLVVEPLLHKTLGEYLSEIKIGNTVSGLGFDVGQRLGEEPEFDYSGGFLEQRRYAVVEPDYTKPVVITKPVRWGVGFHRIKGVNYHIDSNLYLFHFGCFDLKFLEKKLSSNDLNKMGWEKHLMFRRHTIDRVSEVKRPKDGEKFIPIARFIQRIFRAPYHWNRPSMFGQQVVIRIPERFSTIV